ncbi:MAG: NAD(P)-dependent alcohol dehydrogenase [Acidimicrobiales bacterium]
MGETQTVAVLHAVRDLRIEQRPVPVPGPEEVLVAVRAVGVCGSDVHYYEQGRIGPFVVEAPLVLGHEASGIVVENGAGARRHRIGQRVAIEPGRPCGHCATCRSGTYNLCPSMRFLATPPVDGALAQYVAVHQDFAVALPDHVSDEVGALLEPLSVGIWACQRAGVRLGTNLVVTGAGPIGLCTSMVALASGALVSVIDPVSARRARADKLGASATFSPGDPGLAALAGSVDTLIDCSGSQQALGTGIALLGLRGTAVLVGMAPDDDIRLPLSALQQREITVTGTFRYAHTYPTAVQLVASAAVDLADLVDARFSLEQAEQALRCTSEDPSVVKAMVIFSGRE